jgi:hypothetical protein
MLLLMLPTVMTGKILAANAKVSLPLPPTRLPMELKPTFVPRVPRS